MRIIATIFTSLALLSGAAEARPVSYPDAWTVMLRNDVNQNSAHIHYTLDTQHSVGLRLRYDREGDFTFTGGQLNRLIKRWNKVDSQANLYGRVALGQVSDNLDDGEMRLKRENDEALFFGVSGDWETRLVRGDLNGERVFEICHYSPVSYSSISVVMQRLGEGYCQLKLQK